ncbi:MAG: hypothetical protein LBG31_03545 [Prevotellaceae bacterium]|nr:hypothetical protein [Prevotellaceae bacterium]
MNNPVRKRGVKCVSAEIQCIPLLFARRTAGASWKTRAPREVQGGTSCIPGLRSASLHLPGVIHVSLLRS